MPKRGILWSYSNADNLKIPHVKGCKGASDGGVSNVGLAAPIIKTTAGSSNWLMKRLALASQTLL